MKHVYVIDDNEFVASSLSRNLDSVGVHDRGLQRPHGVFERVLARRTSRDLAGHADAGDVRRGITKTTAVDWA